MIENECFYGRDINSVRQTSEKLPLSVHGLATQLTPLVAKLAPYDASTGFYECGVHQSRYLEGFYEWDVSGILCTRKGSACVCVLTDLMQASHGGSQEVRTICKIFVVEIRTSHDFVTYNCISFETYFRQYIQY